MGYENLILEKNGHVAKLTINRPKVLNALNHQTLVEIEMAAVELSKDNEIRALIVTGSGEKAFVAGADISEIAHFGRHEALEFAHTGHRAMDAVTELDFPVIAQINGFALGGGLELALACDIIFASETAKLGLPEVTLGILPGFGGTQRLSRRVGLGKAREITYSGEHITAVEAHRIHLVDRIYPAAELAPACQKFAETIAARGPRGVAFAKEAVDAGAGMTLVDGLRLERHLFAASFTTEDMREGTKAFLEKRKPTFKGE